MYVSKCNFIQQHEILIRDAPEFCETFQYGKVYFGFLNDGPVTVEEFVDGQFAKYINNNDKCKTLPVDMKCIYQKAQSLIHHSYDLSNRKFILLDIQGSIYNLYDHPEIDTSKLFSGEGEFYFCSGNLSEFAISNFVKEHVCSGYCGMLALETLLSSNDDQKCKSNWRL